MRTIVIGDIHGCFQELTVLLKKVDFDQELDRLISLGDLIDRGEQSYEVFDLFRRLKLSMGERCVLIRGNHEQMMLDSATDPDSQLSWRSNGGGKTVRSFRSYKDDIRRHAGWFREHMALYFKDTHFQCTHAGLQDDPIDRTPPDILLWDRASIRQNTYDGRLTIIGHTPLNAPAHFLGNGQSVMLLPYHKKMPLPETGLICLDTGCVFQGRLTAMVIEGRRFWLEAADWGEKMPEERGGPMPAGQGAQDGQREVGQTTGAFTGNSPVSEDPATKKQASAKILSRFFQKLFPPKGR